jgi:hypothetical protein
MRQFPPVTGKHMKNNLDNGNYVTVKVSKALADEIDRIVESRTLG